MPGEISASENGLPGLGGLPGASENGLPGLGGLPGAFGLSKPSQEGPKSPKTAFFGDFGRCSESIGTFVLGYMGMFWPVYDLGIVLCVLLLVPGETGKAREGYRG